MSDLQVEMVKYDLSKLYLKLQRYTTLKDYYKYNAEFKLLYTFYLEECETINNEIEFLLDSLDINEIIPPVI